MSDSTAKTILVVDDDALNRELMEAVLSLGDYRVVMAYNGQKALDLVQDSPPDMIILDIKLPDISGIDVTRKLKTDSTTQHIPILMVTAFEDPTMHDTARKAGANKVLKRPISADDLLEIISNHFT